MSEKDWVKELENIMEALRHPQTGCPWDLEQSHKTLKPYFLEEVCEFFDAIDNNDIENMEEELGDILLSVVFHAQLAKEKDLFNLQSTAKVICEKMIRRHPHVFADTTAESSEEVLKQWAEIKIAEKGGKVAESALDGVPQSLPALMKAQKIQKKAAKVNFDWPDKSGPLLKIQEEFDEVKEAIDSENQEHIQEEIGDLLLAVVNLSRHCKVDAEDALRMATNKFKKRFEKVECEVRKTNRPMTDHSLEELDIIWEKIKKD